MFTRDNLVRLTTRLVNRSLRTMTSAGRQGAKFRCLDVCNQHTKLRRKNQTTKRGGHLQVLNRSLIGQRKVESRLKMRTYFTRTTNSRLNMLNTRISSGREAIYR